MEITYHGHSCFKFKGKAGTVVTDPYHEYVGFKMPSLSADVVTVSHDHKDHNQISAITGTARKPKPFIINEAGEYEVGGISVFGVVTAHDANGGVERGQNIVFTSVLDDVKVCHLGDLGHELSNDQLNQIGSVDVLIVPVGGVFTINPALAVKTIRAIEPYIVIPMHYKTDQHAGEVFGELATLGDFMKEYGADVPPVAKLTVDRNRLPEETQLVVMANT